MMHLELIFFYRQYFHKKLNALSLWCFEVGRSPLFPLNFKKKTHILETDHPINAKFEIWDL